MMNKTLGLIKKKDNTLQFSIDILTMTMIEEVGYHTSKERGLKYFIREYTLILSNTI